MNSTFLDEIMEQPEAMKRTLKVFEVYKDTLRSLVKDISIGKYKKIVFTGMGISYYNCYPSWLRMCNAGINAIMIETSELVHYSPKMLNNETLLIAISQSGKTIESVRLVSLGNSVGYSISITSESGNTLSNWSNLSLITKAGIETSTSTKTYTTALVVLHLLTSIILGEDVDNNKKKIERLSDDIKNSSEGWKHKTKEAVDFLDNCTSINVIGRGPSLASVFSSALIIEETSKLMSAGLSSAQFRHGPMEIVREGFLAIIFAGDEEAYDLNKALASEISEHGGKVIFIASKVEKMFPEDRIFQIEIPVVSPYLLPLIEILPVQYLTIDLAKKTGFSPDSFLICSKITTRE